MWSGLGLVLVFSSLETGLPSTTYSADCIADHFSIATKLREIQGGRRLNAAEKKKAAAELNKATEGNEMAAAGSGGKKRRQADVTIGENTGS